MQLFWGFLRCQLRICFIIATSLLWSFLIFRRLFNRWFWRTINYQELTRLCIWVHLRIRGTTAWNDNHWLWQRLPIFIFRVLTHHRLNRWLRYHWSLFLSLRRIFDSCWYLLLSIWGRVLLWLSLRIWILLYFNFQRLCYWFLWYLTKRVLTHRLLDLRVRIRLSKFSQ